MHARHQSTIESTSCLFSFLCLRANGLWSTRSRFTTHTHTHPTTICLFRIYLVLFLSVRLRCLPLQSRTRFNRHSSVSSASYHMRCIRDEFNVSKFIHFILQFRLQPVFVCRYMSRSMTGSQSHIRSKKKKIK